jgi:antitoxin HigA-1
MSKSSITTRDLAAASAMVDADELHNPRPGEILKHEFLEQIGLNQNQLARAIGIPRNRVSAIVNGTGNISADIDLRLCRFFGLSEGYFLRLQNAHDTLEAKRCIGDQLAQIKPFEFSAGSDSDQIPAADLPPVD